MKIENLTGVNEAIFQSLATNQWFRSNDERHRLSDNEILGPQFLRRSSRQDSGQLIRCTFVYFSYTVTSFAYSYRTDYVGSNMVWAVVV